MSFSCIASNPILTACGATTPNLSFSRLDGGGQARARRASRTPRPYGTLLKVARTPASHPSLRSVHLPRVVGAAIAAMTEGVES